MKNAEIAAVFDDIAEILKLRKDNVFKIRAYRKVAHAIKELPEAVEQLVIEDRVHKIPGVGEAIAGKIGELVTTGKLAYYERLKAEYSEKARPVPHV
jgi:DNA polymerase (family 10)